MLPEVKIKNSLIYIVPLDWKGLMSVIDSWPIVHLKTFSSLTLLSKNYPSFPLYRIEHHEHQLAMPCLSTMVSSALHLKICNMEISNIRSVNIDKSAISPLLWHSSWFLVDRLVHIPCKAILVEVVMYEKMFWMEVQRRLIRRLKSWKEHKYWRYVGHLFVMVHISCWLARCLTPIMSWPYLFMIPSDSFLHSSFLFLKVLRIFYLSALYQQRCSWLVRWKGWNLDIVIIPWITSYLEMSMGQYMYENLGISMSKGKTRSSSKRVRCQIS